MFSSRASVGKILPVGQKTFNICLTWMISRSLPKIVFGLESTNMHFLQNAFFHEFFLVLRIFMEKLFFLRFCHFKFTLFSKNTLQSTTNTKTKILMDLQRIYTQKNESIGLQGKKFNLAPKIKMVANLELLLKKFTLTAWFVLEFIILILYFMRLHSLNHEKRKKIVSNSKWC
jgi:hypothetical protein